MKPLDEQLQSVLKRKEPPEGFAERVLVRLETAFPKRNLIRRTIHLWRWPVLRWVAVAAACLVAVAGAVRYEHQRRVHAQADQAGRQAIQALEIARAELNSALEQAQRITVQALAAPRETKTRME
ncbi:MAG: hypothetical protein M1404_03975 [Acidobacteria bacterium]|nr:hypothetical protein [Acidobacteriota bacterium]